MKLTRTLIFALLIGGTLTFTWAQEDNTSWPQVDHLFVHPLIVYPEKAFGPQVSAQDREYISDWHITTREFGSLLDQLYKKNYILVDIYSLFDPKTLKPLTPGIPMGKKPLLFSIDDLSFYSRLRRLGGNSRLEINPTGSLVTQSENPQGKIVFEKANETVTILEEFITAHPDFSFKGARGIIALTGYLGLFGWHPEKGDLEVRKTEAQGAKLVADYLKSKGWRFASHSWFHQQPSAQSDKAFFLAEEKWIKETKDILGPTDLYIYPFGAKFTDYPLRQKWLQEQGFHFFFDVSKDSSWKWLEGAWQLGRIPLDGKSLRTHFSSLKPFLDFKTTMDPQRASLLGK